MTVDLEAFEAAMDRQRAQARAAARAGKTAAGEQAYRSVLDTEGQTVFVGQRPDGYSAPARVVAVLADLDPDHAGQAEIFLDRTPFYAEGGGQVGDTGTIVTETGTALVYDTVSALPGLTSHRAPVTGELFAGQDALATIDGVRRDALRRNHTGTHLLHAALRTVLGDHVRQQGSLVAPDRLRFDFSHHGNVAPEELAAVAAMANADVLTDADVIVEETTKAQAEAMGALAFFGDKYGERVRVVRAGPHSIELCGGTHVGALGMIGPITVISESSIGSNTRRIEAVTGASAFDRIVAREGLLAEAAALLRTEPEHVPEAIDRLIERQRAAEKSLEQARSRELQAEAGRLAADGRGRGGGGPAGRTRPRPPPGPGPGGPDHRPVSGSSSSGAARTAAKGQPGRLGRRTVRRTAGGRRRPGEGDRRPARGRRRWIAGDGRGRGEGSRVASTGRWTRRVDILAPA